MALSRRHFNMAAAAAVLGSPAIAQVGGRPVRIVVGFPAGGGLDQVVRVIAQQMGSQLGQSFIVDNKPGGDGIIAADAAAKAQADGSTIYVGSGQSLIATPLLRGPSAVPYDPFKDFTPITQMGLFTLVWVTAPNLPSNSVAEFASYVRARPGQLNYAGTNTTTRLAALQFLAQHKLEMAHIPYKGEPPAFTDLMTNRVQMLVGTLAGVRPYVKDGKMKALMLQRGARTPALPEVPTTMEAGANIKISPWSGIFGPANMPQAVVTRYSQAYRAAVSGHEVREQFEQLGFEPVPTTPAEMAAIHRSEYEVFRKAVQEDGIKFD